MAETLHTTLSERANALLRGAGEFELLEAGCGSATHFQISSVRRSVGIDISPAQLEKNSAVTEKILGDIQTFALPSAAFDIVICWNVIEHLEKPGEALKNFAQTLRPGGILILGFPNLYSFKGLVTKWTPFWFHTLYYRLMRYHFRPFETYLRPEILPHRLVPYLESLGLHAEYQNIYEGGVSIKFRRRFPPMAWVFDALNVVVKGVSFGKAPDLRLDNCAFIFVKR
jgi:SAM-dependent methyltransferase